MTVWAPGTDPRPLGEGWELTDYEWDEHDGVGYYRYERSGGNAVHEALISQPGPSHDDWPDRAAPRFDYESTLDWLCDSALELRAFEARQVEMARAFGVYP